MKKLLLILAFLFAAGAFAQQNAPAFDGHGEAVLIPSQAEVWLTVYYKGPEVGELFGRLEGESARIHDIMKKIGISKQDIRDEGNKITELYDSPTGTDRWDRYMLSRKIGITAHDLTLIPKVLAKAKEEEIEQIDGPFFKYPDRGKLEEAAFQDAIKDAKKKAESASNGKPLGEPKILSKNVSTAGDPSFSVPGEQRLLVDITASFN